MARSRQVEVEIVRLGGGGDGVAESPAGPLYVPFTLPGDRAQVEIGEKLEGGGRRGRLVALIDGGEARVEPPCPHFHACGGCQLQHAAPAFYAEWKRQRVAEALARRGLDGGVVAPLRTIPPAERRRADFVARRLGDKVVLGFHERGSHRIVDLSACLVLDPALTALLAPLKKLMMELLAPGASADLKASRAETGVDLVISGLKSPDLDRRERLARFAEEQDLARLTLADGASGFLDPVARRRPALVRFGGVAVEPPPGSFLQASPAAEQILVGLVTQAVGPAARIADLFAGAGTFSFALSARAIPGKVGSTFPSGIATEQKAGAISPIEEKQNRAGAEVLAVEGEAAQVAALEQAARAAGLRVKGLVRDLARRPLEGAELAPFDALVFDPPRAGARPQAAAIATSKVPCVVGVSCAPGTFARDAKLLVEGGYELERVTPVDQFLWSSHVELVGVFRRA